MAKYLKYIGEEFEDKDRRAYTRIIRIIDFAKDKDGVTRTTFYSQYPKYRAEIVYHQTKPKLIGRKTTVSQKTLDTRYTKISH